jgi:hypothetical protein
MEPGSRKFTFKKKPTTSLKPPEVSDLLNSLQAIKPDVKTDAKLKQHQIIPFKSPTETTAPKGKLNNNRFNPKKQYFNRADLLI